MNERRLLLIFVRNPELGKVKTRLAQTLGEEKTLKVYQKLLDHTRQITDTLSCDKAVYYNESVTDLDLWGGHNYQKKLQPEGDLGLKMEEAFRQAFADGYQSVLIIGSDCYELTNEIIEQAFLHLHTHDVVIGPAKDGGYYLLGMQEFMPEVFKNIDWSSEKVQSQTTKTLDKLEKTYAFLPWLNDVDEEKDLAPELLEGL